MFADSKNSWKKIESYETLKMKLLFIPSRPQNIVNKHLERKSPKTERIGGTESWVSKSGSLKVRNA